jgi:hypothetical protein
MKSDRLHIVIDESGTRCAARLASRTLREYQPTLASRKRLDRLFVAYSERGKTRFNPGSEVFGMVIAR